MIPKPTFFLVHLGRQTRGTYFPKPSRVHPICTCSSPNEVLIRHLALCRQGCPGLAAKEGGWGGTTEAPSTAIQTKVIMKCADLTVARAPGMEVLTETTPLGWRLEGWVRAPQEGSCAGSGTVQQGGLLHWGVKAVASRWRPSGMPTWWPQACRGATGVGTRLRLPTCPWISSAL